STSEPALLIEKTSALACSTLVRQDHCAGPLAGSTPAGSPSPTLLTANVLACQRPTLTAYNSGRLSGKHAGRFAVTNVLTCKRANLPTPYIHSPETRSDRKSVV